jgi:hypothetical protein
MNQLNHLSVSLYPYSLTGDKESDGEYIARLAPSNDTLDNDTVCRSALERRTLSLSPQTLRYAVDVYFEELAYLLCNGFVVANGYFTAKALVKGTFDNAYSHFDPTKHHISFDFQQGAKLRDKAGSILVHVLGEAQQRHIGQVTDTATGAINETLTPGRLLIVQGKKLKLTGDDPSVGIYFTNCLTAESHKVPAGSILENHPAKLLLVVPDLPSGGYQLSIITQYVGRSTPTKMPVTSVFRDVLTVNNVDPNTRLATTLTRTSQGARPERVRDPDSDESAILTRASQSDPHEAHPLPVTDETPPPTTTKQFNS